VDCTNNAELCMNEDIKGYPSMILFKNGERLKDYTSSRQLENLVNFVEKNINEKEEL
jgi:thioredoxin-like negative regulator of GroEL